MIVISSKPLTDEAEWFDETLFPFSKKMVSLALNHGNKNGSVVYMKAKAPQTTVGWYFQQLLKLYSPLIIPGISTNVLVLDADTIFLNPVSFLNKKNGSIFNSSATEHHEPYFQHIERLLPGLTKQRKNISGVSHHMLIQKEILLDLMDQVEELHGRPFWEAFCRAVLPKNIYGPAASEYELYFNFALKNTSQVSLRPLRFANVDSVKEISKLKKEGLHFISYHWYLR